MKKRFFITGTDTDAGKTLVSAALLHGFNQREKRTLGLKPVAAGATQVDGKWVNEDATLLMQYSSVALPYAQVNPIVFEPPIAPHIAAAQVGQQVDLSRLAGLVRGAMMTPADVVLVEGAGGWLVPLNNRQMLSGLARELNLEVILVVGMKLGAINHALLTAQQIKASGAKLAGWVANQIDPNQSCIDENLATLKAMINAPFLGHVPHLVDNTDIDQAAKALDLDQLLTNNSEQ